MPGGQGAGGAFGQLGGAPQRGVDAFGGLHGGWGPVLGF
jgi:hypothetical protein